MTKITITIDDSEKKEYNIREKSFRFSELEKIILRRHAQRSLENAARIAKRTGLSKMTNKEINAIIKGVRKSA